MYSKPITKGVGLYMSNIRHLNPIRRNNAEVHQAIKDAKEAAGRDADGIVIIIAKGRRTHVLSAGTLQAPDRAAWHAGRWTHSLFHGNK